LPTVIQAGIATGILIQTNFNSKALPNFLNAAA